MLKIALVPSYEPDFRLKDLVIELINHQFQVIVINDGSNDNYNEIYKSIKGKATVLEYKINKGKGYALKYGFNYIKENYKNYIVVTMDSDGQHTVSDAIKLCNYVNKHPNELVIGKRIQNKKTPLRSRIGNGITRGIYQFITGLNVYDTQTGLRCFSDKLMEFHLNIEGNRYEYEMNVLLMTAKNNIKITEIEIETIYIDNNSGSHFHTIKDSYKVYKQIIKFSLSSILCFLIDYILYLLFILFIGNITISNVIARILSALLNYSINKNIVFKSNRQVSTTFLEYFLLASFILVVNTLLLNILIKVDVNVLIAKVLVEISLFTLSWSIQKSKIFRREVID